jgi:hypothetical protein
MITKVRKVLTDEDYYQRQLDAEPEDDTARFLLACWLRGRGTGVPAATPGPRRSRSPPRR